MLRGPPLLVHPGSYPTAGPPKTCNIDAPDLTASLPPMSSSRPVHSPSAESRGLSGLPGNSCQPLTTIMLGVDTPLGGDASRAHAARAHAPSATSARAGRLTDDWTPQRACAFALLATKSRRLGAVPARQAFVRRDRTAATVTRSLTCGYAVRCLPSTVHNARHTWQCANRIRATDLIKAGISVERPSPSRLIGSLIWSRPWSGWTVRPGHAKRRSACRRDRRAR
jgi:hypothetical protein